MRIRQIGTIVTVVETGRTGYARNGGHALKAHLVEPGGSTVDSEGDIFSHETRNDRVRLNPHRSALRAVWLLFFLAAAIAPLPALSIGLNGTGTAQILSVEGFGPKLQFGGGGSLQLGIPILDWLDLEVSLGLLGLAPSDSTGGFTYRGLCGGNFGVSAEAYATIGPWERFGQLRAGGGLGAAAVVARYEYTTLYFFYPEIRADGFLEYDPAFLPSLGLRLSIPVSVQFRRDVDYSVALGLGLGITWQFRKAR
jgi:hypothetical protein